MLLRSLANYLADSNVFKITAIACKTFGQFIIMRKTTVLLALFALLACSKENVEDLRSEINCDTAEVSYQGELKALLTNSCAQPNCHIGPNAIGGLDLSTYEDVKQIADNGNLVGRIRGTTGNLMPPPGSGILSDCEISKISAWVDAGAANN